MDSKELQSRRDFFKSAAKKALPIVGAIAISQVPLVGNARERKVNMGCDDNCDSGCSDGCYTGCQGSCDGDCYRGCRSTCSGSCTGDCSGNCYRTCAYTSS
ncbi:MAG: Cys-Xaa-Xaa-Xaa repeat radical SAM target protein [Prevotella sp.]|nr:Cys-Xaa-Xaa-Xaa repeat radical SAM target protein [Prevotella sp.]